MIKYISDSILCKKVSVYDNSERKYKLEKLPNCYYITPENTLYNSMEKKNQKDANIVSVFESINDYFDDVYNPAFFENTGILPAEDLLDHEISNYKKVLCSEVIDRNILKEYINIDININDKSVKEIIIGIISARIIVLKKFLNTSKREYDKVIDNTNGDISDILVRYCDFHKILSVAPKAIVSSSVDFASFKDYLKNGWTIYNVPRIDNNDFYLSIAHERFVEKYPEYEKQIVLK